ncbi:MAG: hypothetical protein B9S33_03695 [Pedosphaera sp. Tous-C6FEB]|nr:MAG: hypothetical protein B9S33_03695 [Pedosphaera sp. Tous-C6FEB]
MKARALFGGIAGEGWRTEVVFMFEPAMGSHALIRLEQRTPMNGRAIQERKTRKVLNLCLPRFFGFSL